MLIDPATGRQRPIVFVNLDIVARHESVVMPWSIPVGGLVGMSLRDRTLEGLGMLCGESAALLVGTTPPPALNQDTREIVSARGVRAIFGPDWFECADPVERSDAIAAWLASHGTPPAIVIDRPGVGPMFTARLGVPDGVELTCEACARGLVLLRAMMEPADG